MPLTPNFVIGISFAAGISLFLAAVLVLRDLLAPAVVGLPRGRRLRRPFNVTDELPARNLTGRIDQAFERLVLETGIDASPVGALALLLFIGLAVGGGLFLYRDNPIAAVLGVVLGMGLGLWYLRYRAAERRRQIRDALPDTLDLMSRAVRAGESLDQALHLIAAETTGPLAKEFQLCAGQLDMGMSLGGVMKSLMRRVRIMEIRLLATTLMVHRQTGGNLALTLERMSQVIRERINYQRQMRATTGAGRASAVLIASASPFMFLFMFVFQYDHLKVMFDRPLGQSLLAAAVVLEITGILWVAGILKSDR